ncbi:hypothetical protein [Verrucomicrobium sp. BvORR106]|uniref:hypothetical protein n=1 Tax=Verrucomicrobium sp. BvORR106 TaxID=1403819 RepID=UPI00056E262F|nr:hypothetical protein [Verrucomicrobium sp. BvORR106]
MSALILASSLTVFWFLAGLMLPGYALRIRCEKWIPFSSAAGDTAVHAMALGLLWSTLQFFVVHALALDLKGQPATAWLVKQGTDAALIALCSLSSPGFWKNYIGLLTGLVRQLCQPLNLAGMVLALSFAAFAIFQFPYASDNAALYWMAGAVMKPGVSFLAAQGSPGYIAWLYWPSVLLAPTIPAATVAAGSKLVLNLLAFFCSKRLCAFLPGASRAWAPVVLYILFLTTMMGDYGLFISAKETPFAVLFLFAGMARWVWAAARGESGQAGVEAGALFSLAFGFGAITIPYLAVFLCLVLVLQPLPRPGRHLLAVAWWCGLPLSFSLATMLHQPQWLAGVGTVVGVAALWLLSKPIDSILGSWHQRVQGKQAGMGMAVLVASMAACWLLLPVEFTPCSRSPLDGKSDFTHVFFLNHWATRPYVGVALAGMLVMLVHWRRQPWQPGLAAILVFPFAALLPSLVVAHLPHVPLPFHPQHLWDLAKDIPNWCWGPLATFSALGGLLVVVDRGSRILVKSERWQPLLAGSLSFVFLAALGWHQFGRGRGIMMFRLDQGAHFSDLGGHRHLEMSLYSKAVLSQIGTTLKESPGKPSAEFPLFTYSEAPDKTPYLELNSSYTRLVYSPQGGALSRTAVLNHPAERGFIIASRQWHESTLEAMHPQMSLIELVPPVKGEAGDSLFFFRKTPGSAYQVQLGEERLFRLTPPTLTQNLGLQPQIHWGDFASTKPRTKDGHLLIWGKQEGTLWLELPRHLIGEPVLKLRVRFMGENRSQSALTVTSPLLSAPVELTQTSRSLKSPVQLPSTGDPWVPVHFKYTGDLDTHPTLGYLKSYYLDELRLGDAIYLE